MFNKLINLFVNKGFETKQETNKPTQKQSYHTTPIRTATESMAMLDARGNINRTAVVNRTQEFNPEKQINTDYNKLSFTEAKTIDEANNYTKTVLGIQDFNFENDLETANYINEGLTNLQNIYKGKLRMPDKIRLTTKEDLNDTPMAVFSPIDNKNFFTLLINKDAYDRENLTTCTDKMLDTMEKKGFIKFEDNNVKYAKAINKEQHEKLVEEIIKYKKDKNLMSKYEVQGLNRGLEDYIYHCVYKNLNDEALENLYNDKEKLNKVQEKYPNLPAKAEIDNMSQQEKLKLVNDIYNKTGVSMDVYYAMKHFDKFDILYHEIGHLMHEQNLGNDTFYSLNHKGKISGITREFLTNKNLQNVAERVSIYSKTSPLEFVAETHIGICNGFKYPKKVMDLYRYFRGPEPQANN